MAERARKKSRERAGKSLNLILWFAFSLFALLVVVVFVLVQNVALFLGTTDVTGLTSR